VITQVTGTATTATESIRIIPASGITLATIKGSTRTTDPIREILMDTAPVTGMTGAALAREAAPAEGAITIQTATTTAVRRVGAPAGRWTCWRARRETRAAGLAAFR
jgi:hypothetical protein